MRFRRAAVRFALIALIGVVAVGSARAARVTDPLLHSDGRLQGNLERLTQRVASESEDGLAWRDLGVTQARLGLYSEALDALVRASRILGDDPWTEVYRALTLEMLGSYGEAAQAYEKARGLMSEGRDALRARASLLRAREQRGLPETLTAPSIALLPPLDLSGANGDLSATVASALVMGLSASAEVSTLNPSQAAQLLDQSELKATIFDDPEQRDRTGRQLSRRGISSVLSSSYLVDESGRAHYRLALFPVSSQGVAPPVTPVTGVGRKGAELAPLAASLPELWKGAGAAAAAGQAERWMPASFSAAADYRRGLELFEAGQWKEAGEAFDRAASSAPGVAVLGMWRDAMREALPVASDPMATALGQPGPMIEGLRRSARIQHEKESDDSF